ncbi:hypothetical protein RQP46_007544 [Phenoliferia psychrophenolica]
MLRGALRVARSPVQSRGLATAASSNPNFVRILEAAPRDGLQNEPQKLSVAERVEFIDKLSKCGFSSIEGGAFVHPKWIPQMAGSEEVLASLKQTPGVRYPVLTPNMKALDRFLESGTSAFTDEVAVFTAASESFNKANLNCTIRKSMDMLAPVVEKALKKGLRVRGYVSTVLGCPFEGAIDPEVVRRLSKELFDLGCYEVSLGDTIGTGNPQTLDTLLNAVSKDVPISNLAVHMHDSYGSGVANVLFAVQQAGIRAVDSSIAGLGGCPCELWSFW